MTDLNGKNIIVTGATGGIGNSIIEKLYKAGANIMASGTKIEKLDVLKRKYENIKTLKFNISEIDKIEEFIENATTELGGNLDGIVNNAGVTQDNLAIRMSLEEWQKVININLTASFLMCKSAIKKMEAYVKNGEKEKAKKFYPEFQSVLMQVAKSGVINKKTAGRKISKISKRFK